jgi:2-amino-4-hydroxy-6-hydroxymethyldihydropteridine diphosphokinase/dihydropteroate synthase
LSEAAAEVFIGIGSNLGYRFLNIRKALRLIAEQAIAKMRISVVLETKAILPSGAPVAWDLPYLNLVISGETSLSPKGLLANLKNIEKTLGRDLQAPRWAPRVIDLDILAWDEKLLSEDTLKIPHPELMNRPFLVSLMASLSPTWCYPVAGFSYSHKTLTEILHTQVNFDSGKDRCFIASPQMVGIVNITPDSFSDGGDYFQVDLAIQRIQKLADQGAAVIDIGAQSTRPGATPISSEEEWSRLEPVLSQLAQDFKSRLSKPEISLDSFDPEVIKRALQSYPIDWINDVKGGEDERILKIVAETNCKIVLNHSITIPPSRDRILPFETDPIRHLCDWADKKIKVLGAFGIDPSRIILDPGIGFGKSPFQSLSLLRDIDSLKGFGCEILIGHSRKSFLKILVHEGNRDLETLGISHYLLRKGVDYLRVHDVEAHQKALSALTLLEGAYV